MIQQGTREWTIARLGKITASRFGDCVGRGRNGGLTKTCESYLLDLVGEALTGEPASTLKTVAMEWGHTYEPVARDLYEDVSRQRVEQVGFVRHPTLPHCGCSPDGLVGEHGLIEIKCPMTPAKHVIALCGVPDEHLPQIYGQMWVTGRMWCDFVSYHPKFPEPLQLAVHRVVRDEEQIELLAQSVYAAHARLYELLGRMQSKWESHLGD